MKKALLIIDIQNDYFKHGKMTLTGSSAASVNAKQVLETFRNGNLPVIHVQHIAARPTATFFLPGTKGAEIHDSVKPLETEKVITKHYPNSFRDTELFEYLKKNEITDLVICGMMTHMCIDATVRAAKDYGFGINLIGDACATKDLDINGHIVNADQVQTSFLAALNYFYATVTTTDEYLSKNLK
ncbi:MAG: cysteine hydrolase [Fibrobacter sp.]|nr:cysteine hydrolase [Fibrobacter sp.]